MSFRGNGWVEIDRPKEFGDYECDISFEIKCQTTPGKIIVASDVNHSDKDESFSLNELDISITGDGFLLVTRKIKTNFSSFKSKRPVANGEWHAVKFSIKKDVWEFNIDGFTHKETFQTKNTPNKARIISIGGSSSTISGFLFSGYIRNLKFGNNSVSGRLKYVTR
jgi:hypothetical protein